jgi:C4-dicarboxylate transporter/malic acid transport protein
VLIEETPSMTQVPRRRRLLGDLDHPRAVIAHLGPNWYASVMGTGIVATTCLTLPVSFPARRVLALTFWLLASAMFVLFTLAWSAHWVRHRRIALGHARNPAMASFYGAPPMAAMTVGAGTLLIGRDLLGLSLALRIDLVLWVAGAIGGVASAVVVPYLMFTRHQLEPTAIFGGWLMPVVPSVVTSACGALLVPYLPPGQVRTTLFLGCYALLGLSLIPSMIITTLIWYRLVMHKPDPGRTVPTLWIVLGWVGQSVNAMMLLGGEAAHSLPPSIRDAAPAVRAIAVLYGMAMLGFALLWIGQASAVTVWAARRRMPFALTWWSFTFPLGTVVAGTSAVAHETGLPALDWLAVSLFITLILAWTAVAARTLSGSLRGALFLP